MKKIDFILSIFCVALLCGCAISVPLTKYHNQPNVNECDFVTKDYQVVKTVESTTSSTYVLGIGGFKNRRKNAVEELYRSVNLQEHQQVVNITTSSYANIILGGLVVVKKTTAKGTVIEISDDNNSVDTHDNFVAQPTTPQTAHTSQPVQTAPVQPIKQLNILAIPESLLKGYDKQDIKFADRAFHNACLDKVDINKDGKLTEDEVIAVTHLDVQFWGIKNMKGIELFVNLEHLEANRNQFAEIDLSKNSQLKVANLKSSKLKKVHLGSDQNVQTDVMNLIVR